MNRYVKVMILVDRYTGRILGYETKELTSPRNVRYVLVPRLKPFKDLRLSRSALEEIRKA